MDDWKTILTFTYPHEAHLAQGYLESQGIETFLRDELTVQANNFYSNAIGGVKLQIREEDYEAARVALKEGGYMLVDKPLPIEHIEIDKTANKKQCPFCQSEDIGESGNPSILLLAVFLVLGVFFPVFRRHNKCFNCGREWKWKMKS